MSPGGDSGPTNLERSDADPPWEDVLDERDRDALAAVGEVERTLSGDPRPPGERPAVLVVDVQRHLLGPDVPILEAVEEYRTAMGEVAWRAVERVEPLLEAARSNGTPVASTKVVPGPKSGLGPGDIEIVEAVAPEPGDAVIERPYSSSFYATDLVPRLVRARVDTLVVVGCSTSGCVRAAAVDAHQHGLSVVVPAECTFDRVQASHAVSLLDVDRNYGHVRGTSAVRTYLSEGRT